MSWNHNLKLKSTSSSRSNAFHSLRKTESLPLHVSGAQIPLAKRERVSMATRPRPRPRSAFVPPQRPKQVKENFSCPTNSLSDLLSELSSDVSLMSSLDVLEEKAEVDLMGELTANLSDEPRVPSVLPRIAANFSLLGHIKNDAGSRDDLFETSSSTKSLGRQIALAANENKLVTGKPPLPRPSTAVEPIKPRTPRVQEWVNDSPEPSLNSPSDFEDIRISPFRKLVERLKDNNVDTENISVNNYSINDYTVNESGDHGNLTITIEDIEDVEDNELDLPKFKSSENINSEVTTLRPIAETRTKSMPDINFQVRSGVTDTYCELMNTLKLLEEEEAKSASSLGFHTASTDTIMDSKDDEKDPDWTISNSDNNIADKSSDTFVFADQTNDKISELFTYLDEIEKVDQSTITALKCGMALEESKELGKLLAIPKFQYLTNKSIPDLTQEVITQKLLVEEKQQDIATLKNALDQQRELGSRNTKLAAKELKSQLKTQKDEYEATVRRHQNFIDQLIQDKKKLTEKCEKLINDVKSIEKKHKDNVKAMEERHAIEIKKTKEMNLAAEKMRRDKWIDEKTKQIKQMTVKGLEPEVERIVSKHKQEVVALKSGHQEELLALEERISSRYLKQLEDVRAQMTTEKEEACLRERDIIRQRYEKQIEQEEHIHLEQRRRLQNEIAKEREQMEKDIRQMIEEVEQTKRRFEDKLAKATAKLKEELEESRQAEERKHQLEIRNLKDNLNEEKEAWMTNQTKKFDQQMAKREADIKDECRRNRDREIQMAVERLEAEANFCKTESDKTATNKLQRIREKYESEIQDMENTEKELKTAHSKIKTKLQMVESELEAKMATLQKNEYEKNALMKTNEKLQSERSNVTEVVRQEFVDKMTSLNEQLVQMKVENAENVARYNMLLERKEKEQKQLVDEKVKEISEVQRRVKQALQRKDDALEELKKRHEESVQKCLHLEQLLEQQRRDFLLK